MYFYYSDPMEQGDIPKAVEKTLTHYDTLRGKQLDIYGLQSKLGIYAKDLRMCLMDNKNDNFV